MVIQKIKTMSFCFCIFVDTMLRCYYSEGLCLYWFVCVDFRCIICGVPILTSVPKLAVFVILCTFLSTSFLQLSPFPCLSHLPDALKDVPASRIFKKHHFVLRWMSESLMPAAFLRFRVDFPMQEHCCELLSVKRSILISQKRSTDLRSVRFSARVRNYWVTGWGAEGVGY